MSFFFFFSGRNTDRREEEESNDFPIREDDGGETPSGDRQTGHPVCLLARMDGSRRNPQNTRAKQGFLILTVLRWPAVTSDNIPEASIDHLGRRGDRVGLSQWVFESGFMRSVQITQTGGLQDFLSFHYYFVVTSETEFKPLWDIKLSTEAKTTNTDLRSSGKNQMSFFPCCLDQICL